MSDTADLVEGDELQSEFESAGRRQSSDDTPAPTRLIRAYDRQVVGQCVPPTEPPPYVESSGTADQELPKYRQQQQYGGWQQSTERGGYYPRETGQTYNHQAPPHPQFQQPAAPQPPAPQPAPAAAQPVSVIRMADGTYSLLEDVRAGYSSYRCIRITVAMVFSIIGAIALIIWLATK